jgi:hypothetical protein
MKRLLMNLSWALCYYTIVLLVALTLVVYTPQQILLRTHQSIWRALVCFLLVGVISAVGWFFAKASTNLLARAYKDAKVLWPKFGKRMEKELHDIGFKDKEESTIEVPTRHDTHDKPTPDSPGRGVVQALDVLELHDERHEQA